MDQNGIVTWTTVKDLITATKKIIGLQIDDILYPEDARNYKKALLAARCGGGPQWVYYTIQTYNFIALVEFLKQCDIFVINEGRYEDITELPQIKRLIKNKSDLLYGNLTGSQKRKTI